MAATTVRVNFKSLKASLNDRANALRLLGDASHKDLARALTELSTRIHDEACGSSMAQVFRLRDAAAARKYTSARNAFKKKAKAAGRKKR